MNIFFLSAILVFLIILSLAIFVLTRDFRNEANQAFCLLGVSLACWNLRYLLLHLVPNPDQALDWIRIMLPLEFFIPPAFYHFVLAIINDHTRPRRILLVLGYLIGFIGIGLSRGGYVFQEVEYIGGAYFPIIDDWVGHVLLAGAVLLMCYGLYLLYQRYRLICGTKEKTRLGYLLFSFMVGGVFSLPYLLLAARLVMFKNMLVYLSVQVSSLGFTLLISYVIVKHRLMDITIVIRKSLIYSLITGFITAVFLINIILFSNMFQNLVGFVSLAPSIIAATAVAFLFQPMREKAQSVVDNFFFRERYDQQKALFDFSQKLISILDRQDLCNYIFEHLYQIMRINQVHIFIYNNRRDLYSSISKNHEHAPDKLIFQECRALVYWLKKEQQPLIRKHISDYRMESGNQYDYKKMERELKRLKAELCIPLLRELQLIGFLCLGKKQSDEPYNQQDIELLTILTNEAAIALENANLYQETKDHLFNTVTALSAAVEAKDLFTNGHCERVVGFAVQIASRLQLPKKLIDAIRFGAILHDIGKIGVNESILHKPDRLNEHEFAVVKAHPITGMKILKSVDLPPEVMDIVKYHHERYDGGGYPYGLGGDSIPLVARILAVADAYESMTSDRVYRPALRKEDALGVLRLESGKQFDPHIVEVFTDLIE